MKKFYLFLLLSCLSFAGYSQSSTFTYTGSVQIYTVGGGVSSIGIDMRGGAGGNYPSEGVGGGGGRVQCNLAVTGGEVLYIYVGQVGTSFTSGLPAGGLNSGGGADGGAGSTSDGGAAGGAATDIRTVSGSTMASLSSRIVVAGGGGGGAWDCSDENGGGGGGTTGGLGLDCGAYNATYEGGPGTPTSPGAAGDYTPEAWSGTAGGFGLGGNAYSSWFGGGGGGGWFGAGGAGSGGGCGGSSYAAPGITSGVTHTPGAQGVNTGNGQVIITVLCAAPGAIVGSSTVCTGATTNYTNPTGATGGTWSSSNPTAAIVSSAGVVSGLNPGSSTITYVVSNPCGGVGALATKVITVSQSPSYTASSSILCTGQATTFVATPTGGVWSSTNTAAAVVTAGAATGVAAGTSNIVYTNGGCAVTQPVTVNVSPNYNTVTETGTGGYCAGNPTVHIGLNGSSTGVSYELYSGITPVPPAMAGTGSSLDFGLITAPGSYTVIGTTTGVGGGCSLTMIGAANVFLNPNPAAIAGSSTLCAGSTVSLTSTPTTGTWTSGNISAATVNPTSGVVSGVGAGVLGVTYTLAGGCNVTKQLTVNAVPAPIAGGTSICPGTTTILNSTTTGGTWSSSNPLLATAGIGSGVISGVSAGTPNISYTLSTGCYATIPVLVNLLPAAYAVTGGGGYCGTMGTHIGLSYSTSGVNYELYNSGLLVGTVGGSNSGLDFGLQTATGTYTVFAINPSTNCSQTMSGSTVVFVNPLPTAYPIGGGGNYCAGGAGVPVTLSSSDFGTSYQLMNGATPVGSPLTGTSSSLNFGMQTVSGVYTVVATTTAGCSRTMTGSVVVGVNNLPTPYPLTGGGTYCANGTGADVTLGNSDPGVSYTLYVSGTSLTSITGTGSPIDFGLETAAGSYTVVANDPSTTCSGNMAGSPVITILPLPTSYNVNGGGNYCGSAGEHVGLEYSDPGFSYQLYNGGSMAGAPLAGSSSGLDFGLQYAPGVYTVVATNGLTGCMRNMSGTAVIGLSAPPASYPVNGGGPYCTGGAGDHVGLEGSATGVHYQLYNGTVATGGALAGTGASIDFGLHTAPGTYTVLATNMSTGCTGTMSGAAIISVVTLPASFNVTTAGSSSSYCAGGAGVDILLNGSETTSNYQLYKGIVPVGTSMTGTGSTIDFGSYTTPGVYTIVASNPSTSCSSNMTGNVPVTISPLPTVYTATGGGSYCLGGAGVQVGLSGSATGINYQLLNGGVPVPSAVLPGTGVALSFGYQSATGDYTVMATNNTTTCTSNMAGNAIVIANDPPDPFAVTGDGGSYCTGSAGSSVGISGSVAGINYRVYNGTAAVGSSVAGSGLPLSIGSYTAGTYNVVATNSATGCTSNMPGTATITMNALPTSYTVGGGGPICSGGSGAPITLANSDAGTNYQLYLGGAPIGGITAGAGSTLSFGPETLAGTYTIAATNAAGCTGNMAGSASINIIPSPNAHTVIGGGSYCAGTTGVHVGLNGSDAGISYQLYNGSAAVGGLETGTGFALDFGLQTTPGSYTIVASPGGACQTTMSELVTVVIVALPAVYSITGGGTYCAGGIGVPMGLSGSSEETSYQLYNGTTAVGLPVLGGGSTINFLNQTLAGAYTVIATDPTPTHCTNAMGGSGSVMVNVGALPHAYNVGGGGSYCTGGDGLHITLSSSNTDINYQLYNNATGAAGIPMAGSGTHLDFGPQTTAGNYWIIATDAATLCMNNMNDTASIAVDAYLQPNVTITGNPTNFTVAPGQAILFTAAVTGGGTQPLYQWYVGGLPVGGATNQTFTSSFSNSDSVRCMVTSAGLCGGLTGAKSVVVSVDREGVQQITASGSDVVLVPNPNNGEFTVRGTLGTANDEEVTLEVTDMVGHVVYTDKIIAYSGAINEKISLSNTLANGMYILSLRSSVENKVFHMVIAQ